MDSAATSVRDIEIVTCPAENLGEAIDQACQHGGRLEMAYSRPVNDHHELRYLINRQNENRFLSIQTEVRDEAPSLAVRYPLLGWYEREITDLYGIRFQGHPEPQPLIRSSNSVDSDLVIEGEDIQRLPWGPVRADVVESAEFTFYYAGEAIIHYHPRLFFKHRGIERRFEGMDIRAGVVLAERVSGIGSFAHALAFSEACEAAAGCEVPARARQLRSLLAELERIYNHLAYLGHLADTTTLKVGQAEGKLLAERAKQINGRLTGSRFLRGVATPGGLRRDLEPQAWFELTLDALRSETEWYVGQLMDTNSFRDRLISTGILGTEVAFDQGATGPIARASGLDRELRRDHPYAGYIDMRVAVPVRETCDADARFQVRVAELFISFDLVKSLYRSLEDGLVVVPCSLPPGSEGLGWAESPRGSLFYAVHADDVGRLQRVKIKSPSFSNWRVFPFTVEDSNMMDYAINEASFGLSIAGCDR
jgi:formate hydrogenlyase subunit 5